MNTPVKATASGKVTVASRNIRGFGTAIYIDHGVINRNHVISIYGHLNRYIVTQNQVVRKGDIIGYSGNTGYSKGPHLHFEIRENNKAVNPVKYLGK